MPRVLYTTSELKFPPASGSWLRVQNSIKALSEVAETVLVCRAPVSQIGGEPAIEYYSPFCRTIHSVVEPTAKLSASRILELASASRADVLWLGYGNISYELLLQLRLQRCHLPIVVDTDSVWSRFVLRGLFYQEETAKQMDILLEGWFKRWEESWGTRLGDVTTAVSFIDAQYYRIFSDRRAVRLFSNVIDPVDYQAQSNSFKIQKPCIYLSGTFFPDCPMKEAAEWMLREVMPKIWAAIPEAFLYVVGYDSDRYLSRVEDPRVIVTGTVSSTLPYLQQADVAVVPLKFESGTRIKIKEAGICDIPIVSTTLGAEGLPVRSGEHLLIADTPDAFAQSVIELLKNPLLRSKLTRSCRRLIRERYSLQAATKEANEILHHLLHETAPEGSGFSDAMLHSIAQAYSSYSGSDRDKRFHWTAGLILDMLRKYGNDPSFTLTDEISSMSALLKAYPRNSRHDSSLSAALGELNHSLEGIENRGHRPEREMIRHG